MKEVFVVYSLSMDITGTVVSNNIRAFDTLGKASNFAKVMREKYDYQYEIHVMEVY